MDVVMEDPQHQQELQQDPSDMVQAGSSSTTVVNSMHMDSIVRIAFDTYGRRIATCSVDRFVRIWDLTDTGEWTISSSFPAHRGVVSTVTWAHPEFGPIIATGGNDHDVKIWEERVGGTVNAGTGNTTSGGSTGATGLGAGTGYSSNSYATASGTVAGGSTGSSGTTTTAPGSRWTVRASLTEARRAVTCLEFAPRHWGLKLAVGSSDGCIRIYEAVDIMNLAQWPLAATLEAFSSTNSGSSANLMSDANSNTARYQSLGCTCLSWCGGRFEPPTLVVGGSHLMVYRYSDAARAWQVLLQLTAASATPATGTMGAGVLPAEVPSSHVLDAAWAPNVGRRYHYIASAEDQALRIYRLRRAVGTTPVTSENGDSNSNNNDNNSSNKELELEMTQTIRTNAWRCQWNVTGTVLATAGDGGLVQLYKADQNGQFQCVSQVRGDLSQVANDEMMPTKTSMAVES